MSLGYGWANPLHTEAYGFRQFTRRRKLCAATSTEMWSLTTRLPRLAVCQGAAGLLYIPTTAKSIGSFFIVGCVHGSACREEKQRLHKAVARQRVELKVAR
jgi:hypothetical protein